MKLIVSAVLVTSAAATPPTIVHVIADDLGFNDLGYANGGKTVTPHIDAAVAAGVSLTHYHTYKVCSPTRASLMTGRYPWGVGYYDMKGPEAVPLDFQMLPAVLKSQGNFETHAIGKWNLGDIVKEYTPTFRGFDTFFGYYSAALNDYWYHGNGVQGCNMGDIFVTDLSNSSGPDDADGVLPADGPGINGTYNQELFAGEAVRLIEAHAQKQLGLAEDQQSGLYLYVAFQNVHTASQNTHTISGDLPLHAPCKDVDELYARTTPDTYKVMGAMLTELDYGVGNITAALEAAGRPYVLAFSSDNGGPTATSTNAPLRGGKHTLWDGGIRVRSWVSGSLVPKAQRGSEWAGLAHSSDWYRTWIEGVAGLQLPDSTGPRAPDGMDLWPALSSGGASPRTEVVHQVENDYTKAYGLVDAPTIRIGKYKLILGDPSNTVEDRIMTWPEPVEQDVPFGVSGGLRDGYEEEAGTGRCRAPTLKKIEVSGPAPGRCADGCLFDIEADESEETNLINHTELQDVVASLRKRLAEHGASGPDWAFPLGGDKTLLNPLTAEICQAQAETGFYEPVRTRLPPAPPPSPPAPPPTEDCPTALGHCKLGTFATYDDCLACTRQHASCCCKPVERQDYCNSMVVV